jgi:DNA-binding MarR family transcriptional regulator
MVRDGVIDRTGLTLPDRSTLMVLGQLEPTTARDLSARMDINPGTISVYVQQLVEKGLVERTQDASDRRTWQLSLTDAGRTAFRDTLTGAAEYTRSFLRSLSDDEQTTLYTLLLRVASDLGYEW